MGNRISFSFVKGKEESISFFSHWDGQELLDKVTTFLEKVDKTLKLNKHNESFSTPFSRKEPINLMLNFIIWFCSNYDKTKGDWIESNYYLGKDKEDGDNSDNGHFLVDVITHKIKHVK